MSVRALGIQAGALLTRGLLQAANVVPCERGVYDCDNDGRPLDEACALNNAAWKLPEDEDWVVVLAAIFACLMAFGIGSNDAANSWGTAVGSRAIPLRWATILGGIAEWFGAVSIGYGVSKTIQKGVAKPDDLDCWACGYCDSKIAVYMLGMMTALFAASIFLLLASSTAMPVSTTHAIIGGVVGSTIVGVAFSCLNWDFDGGLTAIIASWVISPVASGIIASIAYLITNALTVNSSNPRRNALWALPVLYGLSIFVMVLLVLLKAKPTKKTVPKGIMALIAACAAIVTGALIAMFLVPYVRKRFPGVRRAQGEDLELADAPSSKGSPKQDACAPSEGAVLCVACNEVLKPDEVDEHERGHNKPPSESDSDAQAMCTCLFRCTACGSTYQQPANSMAELISQAKKQQLHYESHIIQRKRTLEQEDAIFAYRYLLVFIATLESYAHGSNDTANATGAFTAVFNTYSGGLQECKQAATPVWILAVAGFFVFLGMNTFGYRVIRTIGSNLTDINYHRGFCIEFASTFTVVVASVLEMPVSTTHCQVGAVVFVGLVSFGPERVAWGLLMRILLAWVLTIPFAAGISAGALAALRPALFT